MPAPSGFVSAGGRRLEYAWAGPAPEAAPTLVFLHEGLGCLGMWRDVPDALAARTGCGALTYSRAGYGGSDACDLPRTVRYMHDEGLEILPQVLAALGVRDSIVVGHSDGASIAIVYAGGTPAPGLRGLVLEAPHVFTEEIGLASIAAAKQAYASSDLRARLQRHHGANVDCAFNGWADAWTDPAFRDWNLEAYLPGIAAPVLLIQGEADEYGSAAQLAAIDRQTAGSCETLLLPDCGHAPHKDQRDDVLDAIARFVGDLTN